MNHPLLACAVLVATAFSHEMARCQSLPDSAPVVVGTTRQLFLDDFVVAETQSLRHVLHPAVRHPGNPVLVADRPWEGKGLEGPVVFWDPALKRFRMYYWAILSGEVIYTCYAESEDGIRWQKPNLGFYEGPDGSRQNNIVLRGEGKQARTRYVALNPYWENPQKRYVALYIDNVPGLTEFAAYSPDGLHWTTVARIGDLRGTTGGPPTAHPNFFLLEQRWDPTPTHRCRAIWRTESPNLIDWTGGAWVLQRQAHDQADLEFYHATSHFLGHQTYHELHLGYFYPFRTFPQGKKLPDGTRLAGTIDTALMVSRDTIHWQRVADTQPLLPVGPEGSWDAGMVFLHPELVVDRQLCFYYAGWKHEHSDERENEGVIGLATLRLDGFLSLEPETNEGTLTTRPFRLEGNRMVVNADVQGGTLSAEVLDEAGNPLPGFDRASAADLANEDGPDLACRWREHGDLKSLAGRTIRLRFHLVRSKLYAFEIMP